MAGIKLSQSAFNKTKALVKSASTTPLSRRQQQSKRINRGGVIGGGSSTVAGAIIKSGGAGVYIADLLDASGEVVQETVTIIPTFATADDLPPTTHVVAFKTTVNTLGGGE